ncbi:MAG: GNAT family N-acetyltransferase, partial [Bacteroidales bacterium]
DAALARRLEGAEGTSCANFVTARAVAVPGCTSEWRRIHGAFAVADGPDSPLTQTFGLGLFEPPTDEGLAHIETFFTERHLPIAHEVSALAEPSLLPLLDARGYRLTELTSVMYRPITRNTPASEAPRVGVSARVARDDEQELWAATAAKGWSEYPELEPFLNDIARVNRHNAASVAFFATLDGEVIAAGALYLAAQVALLAGASTIPAYRRRGAQQALLECRLQYAAARACDLAMMGARPGTASQHNGERNGFRIAYTRMKWERRR